MNTVRKKLLRLYFSIRNSWPIWYFLLNASARARYKSHIPILSPEAKRITQELARNGIAFSTLNALFPQEDILEQLERWMSTHAPLEVEGGKKQFLKPFWLENAPFDLENPFFKLSLSPTVLGIVNTYDHMYRRLNYLHLAETVPVGDAAPIQSQRWHRDPEEKRLMKFFIYLSDVNENAGPFMYVKGSAYKTEPYGTLFSQESPMGIYPPDGRVEKMVDPAAVISATGTKGTVIFCDTAGLHRGGHARSVPRLMFTAFYPSSWWTESARYTLPIVTEEIKEPMARYALTLD